MFGVVSLLVALAILGLIAAKQLRVVGRVAPATTASEPGAAPLPQRSASGSVAQQARQLEKDVAADVAKAMRQGADARTAGAEKP